MAANPAQAAKSTTQCGRRGRGIRQGWEGCGGVRWRGGGVGGGGGGGWGEGGGWAAIGSTFGLKQTYGSDGEMEMGWSDVPLGVGGHRAENGEASAHVRIGWLRSVSN